MRSISGNSKSRGADRTGGSIHLQKKVSSRLSDKQEAYLRSFPEFSSAALQVMHAGKFPLLTERICECEHAALAVESGAEAFLDDY